MKERITDARRVGGSGGWSAGLMEPRRLRNADIWTVWRIASHDVKWYRSDDNRLDPVGLLAKAGIMTNFVSYIFWYMYIK